MADLTPYFATVTAVPSAAKLTVQPATGAAQRVFLAHVADAPLAFRASDTERPFAFLAREFVRERVIGKKVRVMPLYNTRSGMSVVAVQMRSGEDLATELLRNGLVTLDKPVRGDSVREKDVAKAAAAAVEAKIGVHAAKNEVERTARAIRRLNFSLTAQDSDRLVNKTVHAVVEHVFDGTTMRVYSPKPRHHVLRVAMAGVRPPFVPTEAGAERDRNEPAAAAAAAETELRLTQRDVDIEVTGVDDTAGARIIGRILCSGRDLAVRLLQLGLARIFEPTLRQLPAGVRTEYAEAELTARRAQRGMWKGVTPPAAAPSASDRCVITGRIVDVPSSDSVVIVDNETGAHERVWLSSLFAPRFRSLANAEPWAFEAWDCLRAAAAGRPAEATVEYVKDSKPREGEEKAPLPPRRFATVRVNGRNLAAHLIGKGLAEPMRHRRDDLARSDEYSLLVEAETVAQERKLNMHSGKPAPTHRVHDLSVDRTPSSSHKMLNDIVRACAVAAGGKGTRALVLKVWSPVSMKVFLPALNLVIAVVLRDVETSADSPADATAQLAAKLQLRNSCTIMVEESDAINKGGAFRAVLFASDHQATQAAGTLQTADVALTLLRDGSVLPGRNASTTYEAAAAEAEAAGAGLWKMRAIDTARAAAQAEPAQEGWPHICTAGDGAVERVKLVAGPRFSDYYGTTVVVASPEAAAASLLDEAADVVPMEGRVTRGAIVAACDPNGHWRRAYVANMNRNDAQLELIDTGKTVSVALSALKGLSTAARARPHCALAVELLFSWTPRGWPTETAQEAISARLTNFFGMAIYGQSEARGFGGMPAVRAVLFEDSEAAPGAEADYPLDTSLNAELASAGALHAQPVSYVPAEDDDSMVDFAEYFGECAAAARATGKGAWAKIGAVDIFADAEYDSEDGSDWR